MTRILAILILIPAYLPGQGLPGDQIKIILTANQEPLRGAMLVIKGTNPAVGTVTDIDGKAELTIPKGLQKVEISFLGPYVVLDIITPVDSIYFDISSMYATYYFRGKKMKRKKQTVDRY